MQKTKFPVKMLICQALAQGGPVSPLHVWQGLWTVRSTEIRAWRRFFCPGFNCNLKECKIDYVRKLDNPTSVPQCQPIERFCALCKSEMVKRNKVTYDKVLFKRRRNAVSKQIAEKSGKRLCDKFKAKLRIFPVFSFMSFFVYWFFSPILINIALRPRTSNLHFS